ncbi:hypothetical protein DY245_29495 [Streptomyces inhibens]|uniref:Nucleopolyhedrovirus P10 family protein n=1 Tax=Streptomyces inhibens TaxID=2293571 RepID=A0A371PWT5_STRIH|nr:hypothetical protein [Streptomyces inhibens]REK86940.1 hypothetical protein DY245_29495 [Streptomyces inhibens]
MTVEAWTQAVRLQLELGRLLPLGEPDDGAWITEQAAVRVLGRAAAEVPGVGLETLRVGAIPLASSSEPAVPPPVSALPPGPLRIEATLSAAMQQSLSHTAEQLRSALLSAAVERLGLAAVAADLHITDLLQSPEAAARSQTPEMALRLTREAAAARSPHPAPGPVPAREPSGELADVIMAVPGVARLTPVLGTRPVKMQRHDDPPGRHIEVQLAVAPGHHPLKVARAVRAAVAGAAADDAPGPVTAAVLITEVEDDDS